MQLLVIAPTSMIVAALEMASVLILLAASAACFGGVCSYDTGNAFGPGCSFSARSSFGNDHSCHCLMM